VEGHPPPRRSNLRRGLVGAAASVVDADRRDPSNAKPEQERYEEVVRRLTGKSRIESPADLPFDGLLVHAAGHGPNGFCVFDVFESEEAVDAFRNALGTIPEEVGIEEPPHFFTAHTAMATRIDRE
jgi:2'-5' RNA ligase